MYENIAFAMHVTNVKRREISDRVEYMLELVHLEDNAHLTAQIRHLMAVQAGNILAQNGHLALTGQLLSLIHI